MGDVAFLNDLRQPKPRNAVNVPKMIDDTVMPEERTTGRLPALRGQGVGFELSEAMRLILISLLVGAGLMHLIEKGLFGS